MSLWDEARELLVQRLLDQKEDRQSIEQFLRDKSSVEDAQSSASSLQKDSDRKYGPTESRGKSVSAKWIRRIMDNLGSFINFGDVVMTAAPESAALVWFAVKQVLSAIQNDYKLYATFSGALNDITEIMVLVRTYDKLYQANRSKDGSIYDELCKALREVYISVLDFSYAVKKHLTAGKRSKVIHALKDVVGALNRQFEEKVASIQAQKAKVIQYSEAAFQHKTQDQLGSMAGGIGAVQDSIKQVLEFHQQSANDWKEILSELKVAKAVSHRDLAVAEHEKNIKLLTPWLESSEALLDSWLAERDEGTVEWISDLTAYKSWLHAPDSSLLVLTGEAGTGKSVVGAHVFTTLRHTGEEHLLQYIAYDDASDEDGISLGRVENSILRDIYKHALDASEDDLLLQKCNSAFSAPKKSRAVTDSGREATGARHAKMGTDNSFNFLDVYPEVITAMNKPTYLIIDVADSLPETEQEKFADQLLELVELQNIRVQILLTCRPSSSIHRKLDGHKVAQIAIADYVNLDVEIILSNGLKMVPGLSEAERTEIKSTVATKTGHRIQYVKQIALPFLNTPLRRPVSDWLTRLPENVNETYHQHLHQLAPAYQDLFRFVLSWALVAQAPLHVEEAMDAYTGIYLGDNPGNAQDIDISKIDLYWKQIQQAGGPFFTVREGDYITLQDAHAVRKFCLSDSKIASDTDVDHDTLCSQCRMEIHTSTGISISEKHEHLNMAIICSFQERFYAVPLATAREQAEAKSSPTKADKDEDGPAEDQRTLDQTEGAEDGQKSEKVPDATESVTVEEASKDNDKNTSDDAADTKEETEDDDESKFSDEDEDFDRAQSDSDWNNEYISQSRYEVTSWNLHVQEAERLWTKDERKTEPLWQILLDEMEKFFLKSPIAFEAWKLFEIESTREAWEPLFFAAVFGLTSLSELLFDHGADANALTPGGYTLLHLAAEAPHPLEIMRLYLAKGCDPNFEDRNIPPFHDWFFFDPDLECVKELLAHGASCTLVNKNFGWNVAHYVARYCTRKDVLQHLVEHTDEGNRMSVNVLDKNGETPLHHILKRQNIPLDILEGLLSYGANVNIDDKDSERPLYEASYWGEIDAVKAIIDHIEDIDDDNDSGRTALHAAAWAGQTQVVGLLLEHGADPSRRDKHNRTPLIFSCFTHLRYISQWDAHQSTAELLIAEQIKRGTSYGDINPVTKRGRTPLREASGRGFVKVVELIIGQMKPEDKQSIDKQDDLRGRSALHSASTHGRAEVVAMLLKNGADPKLRDGKEGTGKTSFELCLDRWAIIGSARYEATMMQLINASKDEARQNSLLLTTAAVHGSVAVLRQLADLDVDLKSPDAYGWTPSQLATQFGHIEATAFLRQNLAKHALRPKAWVLEGQNDVTELDADGCHIVHKGDRRFVMVADHPVPAGWTTYYYETEILDAETGQALDTTTSGEDELPIVALGFCTSAAEVYEFPGWQSRQDIINAHSWAYHGDDGGLFSGKLNPYQQALRYGAGDTIGCGVDMEKNQIFFTRNGVRLDQLFKDVKGRLFPILGLHDKAQLRTNFGTDDERPFKWDPSRTNDTQE